MDGQKHQHNKTWRRNDDVSNNVNEKWKIIICLHEIGITCLSILCLIHKVMVRESISKMKTGNSRGPSDVLPEMVKSI